MSKPCGRARIPLMQLPYVHLRRGGRAVGGEISENVVQREEDQEVEKPVF